MHRQAYLLLVLTTLFWGGNPIAGKLALGHISPMLLTAARWGIAAAILAYLGRQRLPPTGRRSAPSFRFS